MSKRKRILGPDGKPYVAPPKPRTTGTEVRLGGQPVGRLVEFSFNFDIANPYRQALRAGHKSKPPALADAVEAQVAALTATFDGVGGEELPQPPRDLTAYDDAFASAAKNCDHPDAEDVAYAKREMYCPTCRRYFKRPRSIWGF